MVTDVKREQLRLAAAVYGEAVGDAVGVPYEFRHRDTFHCDGMTGHGSHDQPAGTWSDDTAMMLATLDSLVDNGWRVDAEDMRRRYMDWATYGKYTPDGAVFDIGTTTAEALSIGHGLDGEWDNGNGSLMRIIPLAFTDCTDDDIRKVSAVTHSHETSMETCVRFIHTARTGMSAGQWPSDLYGERLTDIPREDVRSGSYVRDTYRAALWCLANTVSYKGCVLAAVNLGGDTDTTAAVAGALAGLKYGFESIPVDWLLGLRGRDVVSKIMDKSGWKV